MPHTALIALCSLLTIPILNQAGQPAQDRWVNPPENALRREKPRSYTVGLAVDMGAISQSRSVPNPINSNGGRFNLDFVVAGNWTVGYPEGLTGVARVNGIPTGATPTITGTPGQEVFEVSLPIPKGELNALSFRVEWPAVAFNSLVDEQLAAQVTWPREWPAEIQPFLAPSAGIPSEDAMYREFVARTSGGTLRTVPLYYAAKDLVRAAILEYRNVRPGFVFSENNGMVRGFDFRSIRDRISTGREKEATATDLVCSCVAVLRAAGIPARPVIGINSGKGKSGKQAKGKTVFSVWAEFHLPGSGWVPFDPWNMRGSSMQSANVKTPWKWFGTNKELNRQIAIAYDFAPFQQGKSSHYPAGWSIMLSGSTRAPFLTDIQTKDQHHGYAFIFFEAFACSATQHCLAISLGPRRTRECQCNHITRHFDIR